MPGEIGYGENGTTPLVLIIEQQEHMRRLLRALLASHGFGSVEATTLAGARALCAEVHPSIVLLDLNVSEPDTALFTTQLLEQSTTRVLLVGEPGDNVAIARGLDGGADDYVLKPFTAAELTSRLRLALDNPRNGTAPCSRLRVGPLVLDLRDENVTLRSRDVTLSADEFGVLQALALSAGRVLTVAQIADRAWGLRTRESAVRVRMVVAGLRRKIEVDAVHPRLIMAEPAIGYRLLGTAQ